MFALCIVSLHDCWQAAFASCHYLPGGWDADLLLGLRNHAGPGRGDKTTESPAPESPVSSRHPRIEGPAERRSTEFFSVASFVGGERAFNPSM